jgi:hypothetical protein
MQVIPVLPDKNIVDLENFVQNKYKAKIPVAHLTGSN